MRCDMASHSRWRRGVQLPAGTEYKLEVQPVHNVPDAGISKAHQVPFSNRKQASVRYGRYQSDAEIDSILIDNGILVFARPSGHLLRWLAGSSPCTASMSQPYEESVYLVTACDTRASASEPPPQHLIG